MSRTAFARIVVLDPEDRVLFLCRNLDKSYGGKYDIPGGGLEGLEQPAHGAARELFEEAGITIEPEELQLIDFRTWEGRTGNALYEATYVAKLASQPEVVLEPSEHSAYTWWKLEEVDAAKTIPEQVEIISRYFNKN